MARNKFIRFMLSLLAVFFTAGIITFSIWYFSNDRTINQTDTNNGSGNSPVIPDNGDEEDYPDDPTIPQISILNSYECNEGDTLVISPVFASYPIVEESNLFFNWQKYNNLTASWENIANKTEKQFVEENIESIYNGAYIRLLVTMKTTGNQRASNSTFITVKQNQEYINSVTISTKTTTFEESSMIEIFSNVETNIEKNELLYEWYESSDGQLFTKTDITTPDYTKVATLDDNSKYIKLKVSKKNSSITSLVKESNSVYLIVTKKETQIFIDNNIPTSVNVSEDENLKLNVEAVSTKPEDPISYQWEYKKTKYDTTWLPIDGETSNTLNIDAVPYSWDGYVIRLKLSTSNGTNVLYSNECIINVAQVIPSVTIQDNNNPTYIYTLYENQKLDVIEPTITFTPEKYASNASYQWYEYVQSAGRYRPILNATSPTLDYGVVDSTHHSMLLKLEITVTYHDDQVKKFESPEYKVIVNRNLPNLGNDSIVITSNKEIFNSGDFAELTATIPTINNIQSTDTITYKWQYKNKLNSWVDIANSNNQIYTFNTSSLDNDKVFRFILSIKPKNSSSIDFYSNELKIIVKDLKPNFTNNPIIANNLEINEGSQIELNRPDFTVENSDSTPKFEWEYKVSSTNNNYLPISSLMSNTSININNDPNGSLWISGDTYSLNGYVFRVKVTIDNIYAYSNECTINVIRNKPILQSISYSATNIMVNRNESITVNANPTIANLKNDIIKYQWQVLFEGSSEWVNIKNQINQNLYIPAVDDSWNNSKVRLTVSIPGVVNEQMFVQNYVSITVKKVNTIDFNISGVNSQYTINEEESLGPITANVQVNNVTQYTIKYQWQYSYINGLWINIENETNQSLFINSFPWTDNTVKLRVQVTVTSQDVSTSKYSNEAIVIINRKTPQLNISLDSNYTYTEGAISDISPYITNMKYCRERDISYQWQIASVNSNSFTNIEGANSKVLRYGPLSQDKNNYKIRVIATVRGTQFVSNASILKINQKLPSFDIYFSETTIDVIDGSSVNLELIMDNLVNCTNSDLEGNFKWEYKLPNGSWTTIVGQNRSVCTINNVGLNYNNAQFRASVTYNGVTKTTSNILTMSVTNKIPVVNFTKHRSEITYNNGSTLTVDLGVTIQNLIPSDIVKYSWQIRIGNSWMILTSNDISINAQNGILTINNMTSYYDNKEIRLLVNTSRSGNTISEPILLKMN